MLSNEKFRYRQHTDFFKQIGKIETCYILGWGFLLKISSPFKQMLGLAIINEGFVLPNSHAKCIVLCILYMLFITHIQL